MGNYIADNLRLSFYSARNQALKYLSDAFITDKKRETVSHTHTPFLVRAL